MAQQQPTHLSGVGVCVNSSQQGWLLHSVPHPHRNFRRNVISEAAARVRPGSLRDTYLRKCNANFPNSSPPKRHTVSSPANCFSTGMGAIGDCRWMSASGGTKDSAYCIKQRSGLWLGTTILHPTHPSQPCIPKRYVQRTPEAIDKSGGCSRMACDLFG